MAEAPLVSVVIPTYNSAALVSDGVESALAQAYARVEVIVVDDGSTDDTVAVLRRFGDRIQLIEQEHSGPAVARNAGVRAGRGEVVAFLDSDDLFIPEKVARCVQALQEDAQAGVIYTAVRIEEMDAGRTYALEQYTHSGEMARDLFMECKGVNTSTLVVRRDCFDAVGGFDEDFFRAQDWDLMIRLAEHTQYRHVPETLTVRRLHAKSLSVTHAHLYKKYNLLVLEKALARRPDLYADLAPRAHALAHLRFGLQHYGAFRLRDARAEFREALGHQRTWRAFNYWLRTFLPAGWVRRLRERRLASQIRKAATETGEKAHD